VDKLKDTVKAALTCVRDGLSSVEEAVETIMEQADKGCSGCSVIEDLRLSLATIERAAIEDVAGPEVTE